jgi:hypothetical protein
VLKLRSWYPLAIATATVGVCFTPTHAHALTFTLGGTTVPGTPGNVNTINYSLPSPLNISIGGTTATVTSATITGRGGLSSITTAAGGSLNGAVLKLGNFNLVASGGNIIDPNPGTINTFALFSNTFSFTIANAANIAIKQVFTGSFLNNTTGATNQVVFPGVSVALSNGLATSGSPLTASSNSGAGFRLTSSTNFTNGPAVSQVTISARLSDLILASGQTLNLPASACVVIAEETEHFQLTDEDAARACDEVSAPEPATVPESSSVAGLLAIAAVGGGTWFRRKRTRSVHFNTVQ